jgi:carboxymethylenebutenolidase
MPRVIATSLAWLLVPLTTVAQDWAKERLENSPRHQEWVQVKHDDRSVDSFLVFPEVEHKATGVVVIHEIFGLADWVRSLTDQLAEAGYVAIAPDLLSGMAPGGGGTSKLGGPDGARRAIASLPQDQITADLNAAVDYLAKLPACNGKVVVCGFCWGGRQAFQFATENKNIKAAFVFYGNGPESPEAIQRIAAPIYGFYGGNDARVNATIPQTTELMQAAGKRFDPVIYEGAGHGFMRAGEAPDASPANREARAAAWQRWKKLLEAI